MDLPYYLRTIPAEQSVLVLGCGTGRLTVPLTHQAKRVVGVDIDKYRLTVARENGDAYIQQGRLDFVEADFTQLNLQQQFDVVLFAFRCFHELAEAEKLEQALHVARQHVTGKGAVVIDLYHPNPFWLNLPLNAALNDPQSVTLPDGRQFLRTDSVLKRNLTLQTQTAQTRYDPDFSGGAPVIETYNTCYLYPDQVYDLCKICGLSINAVHGDYQGTAFEDLPEPPEMIVWAHKI